MNAIEEYFKLLKQEIETRMLTLENGGNKTQLFTRYAIDLLKACGEEDNVIVAYDEETNPSRKQHRINALRAFFRFLFRKNDTHTIRQTTSGNFYVVSVV